MAHPFFPRLRWATCSALALVRNPNAMTQTITVIRGDGIGPEIMDAALYVLDSMKAGLAYEKIGRASCRERVWLSV